MFNKNLFAILFKALFIVLGFFNLEVVFPQSQISFGQLSIKEGLSQNCGISVAQDSTGYLWIATQDGLNKYDGTNFVVYPFIFDDITRLDYSHLGKVYVDRQNQVWCIPSSRILNRLDQNNDRFEPIALTDDASVIYQDQDLGYWVGTYSKGLLYSKMNDSVPKVQNIGQIKETIYALAQYETAILAATDNGILSIGMANKQINDTLNETLAEGRILKKFSTITIEAGGRQWFGTYGGGLFFREGQSSFLKRAAELPLSIPIPDDLNILSLFIDSRERLWIGTYGDGLYLIDLDSFETQHFMADKHNPRAVHYNDILSIYEDYTGTLWFGTDGAGLSYYDEYLEKFNAITNFQVPQNINVEVVRAITTDGSGSVWIGTSGKGLMEYIPAANSWVKYSTEGPEETRLPSNRIMSLYADADGDLWIGTQGGGLAILESDGTIINYNNLPNTGLEAITIWDIFKDSEQRYWLATRENGLVQFDKKKGQLISYNEKNASIDLSVSDNIRVITEDNKGNLWLGTDSEGLIHLNLKEQKTTTYRAGNSDDSLSNDMIKSLYFSEDDNILWIGTYGGGLNAFDIGNDRFYSYTEKDGLANNVIYAILPDGQGNLWLSSNRGITKFTPASSLDQTPIITNYTNYEGLATEFNTGAYHIDDNGNHYFGGLEGIYWFKPTDIVENTQLPKTAITGMQVGNEPYPIRPGMKLSHKQNTLSFTFSSMQFSLPEKNQYQYRLVDYDEEWIQAGNTNFARYSHVPPGEYEFQVKSSNYDGVWNPEPATLAFTIAPPWYFTTLAKTVYILLFLMTVYGIYSYLKWRWRMKLNLQLQEDEAHRLKRLNDFKSKLYTDISHEFRTPLTLISGPIDAKLGDGGLSEVDHANFSMIKRNVNRLMALVDQLLHLARLEKGKLKLKVSQGDLGLFLGMLATSFKYRAEQKNIDYTIDVKALDGAWYDEDAIDKIVTNLLSNALKYCPEKGSVLFKAEEKGGHLQLDVKNTVKNFSEKNLDQLFNRFYQQDEYAEGVGVGLSLVKQLVKLYKGEVSVQLEDNDTIHFRVMLPIARDRFSDAQIVDGNQKAAVSNISNTVDIDSGYKENEPAPSDLPMVLVVEDHQEVRQFLASVWKKKYQVFEAANGTEGIKKALEIVPDLIISDVRMPQTDGIELCNTLKTDERTSHIPIILLTAGTGEEQELKGLQSGADDFVTKPFKLRVLEKRVQNLIDSRRALRSRYSQEVILKAKDIAITPTDELFLEKVQTVMDNQLSDPGFNAKTFASAVGMSRMQLHRKLTAMTGLSTTEFIRSQRLKQALHILKTSDATINEVAYAVGFNTPSYFIKCFKETYKKTPAEFLQETD
ncbi:MAG: hybrid sensor histidine kinase/response regulator [Muricauda sp.]|nr:two-component regulator propeller domain-containing protein [Allomuricauda sp.]MAU27219.1 hybrid sensor histidine kinase/response regulator [Allomuricauda sp.]MBC30491.1 hybrid sensor histidine kinase/response regulator [Allomuricauda sp.]|tara:strand:- start:4599 stop:8627 length:4029 start_codon:yes stop_codon:yes gene_type:complete